MVRLLLFKLSKLIFISMWSSLMRLPLCVMNAGDSNDVTPHALFEDRGAFIIPLFKS